MDRFKAINDLETLALAILAGYKPHSTKDPEYRITTSTAMLNWNRPVEAQQVAPNMWRIGAIGDGNCMVHSILFAASPSYRQEGNKHRVLIADKFREILNARVDELKDIADAMYAEMGGWTALEESFDILKRYKRSEVNIEIGPVIARLYGLNFLTVQIVGGQMKPYVGTYNDGRFDPALPSVLINYRSWQIVNLGRGSSSSSGSRTSSSSGSSSESGPVANHYEVIISGVLTPKPIAASSKKKSRRKKDVTHMFAPGTTYVFRPADPLLAPLMVEFERPGKEAKKEEEAQRIRARAHQTLLEAHAATAAAGAVGSSPRKPRSGSGSGSGSGSRSSGTRKRSFASKSPSPAPAPYF
jgi:hypothetical protein